MENKRNKYCDDFPICSVGVLAMITTYILLTLLLNIHLPIGFMEQVNPMLDNPNETIMAYHYSQNGSHIYVDNQVPIKILYSGFQKVQFQYPKGNTFTIHPHREFCSPSYQDILTMREFKRSIDAIVCNNNTVVFFDSEGHTQEITP